MELDWDSDEDMSDEDEVDLTARVTANPSSKPSLSLRNIFRRKGKTRNVTR